MKNIKCMLGFHDWKIVVRDVSEDDGTATVINVVDKVCLRCGKLHLKGTNDYLQRKFRREQAHKIIENREVKV